MASQPATHLDWRTVKASDLKHLSFSQLQALSEARKRDTLNARPETPPRIQGSVSPAVVNVPSGSSAGPDTPSVPGPSRTTRQTSKRSTPYARQERSPKSLEVKRYPRRGPQPAKQTKKSINGPPPESSPEPEEGQGEHVDASEDSIKDTIEMMRAMQRENDALEKENDDLVRQTDKMRTLAKELQQTLTAERARTDRILHYLQHWQRTSNEWPFESIFPRRDVILMTRTDEEAGTTETIEVDREDAEKIPELKRFFEESIETPDNLTESILQSIPPDVLFEMGARSRSNQVEQETDNDDRSKGKGKAREVSFRPRTEQSNAEGSRKRGRTEEPYTDLLNYQVMLAAHQRSKEKHSNETRHFTNLEASGSGSSRRLDSNEPPVKRQRVQQHGTADAGSSAVNFYENVTVTGTTPSPPVEEKRPPFSWNKFGRPLIDLPKRNEMTIGEYVEKIRRGVQFIQAGPPVGFVPQEERRGIPLRRDAYRKFTWNVDGTPDIVIPICHDNEHVNRLLEAVKFLGTWKSGTEDIPEEEEASEPLEHENSVRTLSVEGLRCSWTAKNLPVVTFTTESYDDPQYINNILLASDFILRGPGPGEKWVENGKLPDEWRGHLPKDPMVICTYNQSRELHITLPPPTSPCYYDRIVISAKFIRDERGWRGKKVAMDEAKARNAADELARELAEDDDEKLNASFSLDRRQRQSRVEETLETIFQQRPAEEHGEKETEEKAVEDEARAEANEQAGDEGTKKSTKDPRKRPTKKAGKK